MRQSCPRLAKSVLCVQVFGLWLVAHGGCQGTFRMEDTEKPGSHAAAFLEFDRAAAAEQAPAAAEVPARSASSSFQLVGLQSRDNEPASAPPDQKRVVIYNAAYRLVVNEVEPAVKEVESLAGEVQGWVQEISVDQITIRVPVTRFDEVVQRIETLGRVSHRDIKSVDVTEEYVDLQSRLKNALAVRSRLQALLKRAEDVKAALEVEKELNRIGEEIERLQGKIALLENRVAYSTLSVAFERVYRTAPSPQAFTLPFTWLHELNPTRLTNSD